MIDAVLIADAEYRFTFAEKASAGAKTSAVRDIARRADLSVGLERNDSSTLIGRNLVWGVQDDQLMAYQGIGLPNVGTSSERSRSILLDSGPIAEIDRTQQARRDFNDMAVRIRHDVPAMKQPTPMSCWAAVYAMMESWKGNQPITIERAIARLGEPYETYFTEDRGLPGGQELAFVEAAGLHALPPANYPLSTFRRLLREKGPIWIITGDGITSHARLLVGIYGRDEEEKRSSYELTIMEFIDPAQGSYVYEPALDFFEEFEREAAFIVNSNQDWVDLRWQILSY